MTPHRLSFNTLNTLKFDNVAMLSVDVGTMSFVTTPDAEGIIVDRLQIHVSSGTTTFGGAVGELANASDLQHVHGKVIKTGSGTFETARHFRLNALDIQGGTLRVLSSGTNEIGTESGTSRLNRINFDDNNNPTARLDLRNNDLIVDWKTGDPPTGSLTSASTGGGIARMIQVGYNAGSWNGNGIMSTLATYNDYAVGYATAGNVLTFGSGGTATWSGQTVDETSVLIKFTYYGDATVDGIVHLGDYARLSAHFNLSPSTWDDGDFNYDGTTNIGDYALLANHWGWGTSGDSHPQLRGGPPRLAELFIAMLDHPAIYWESWLDPYLRGLFEPCWSLNLGPAPAIPLYLQSQVQARGVPEPAGAVWVILAGAMAASLRRRGCRVSLSLGARC